MQTNTMDLLLKQYTPKQLSIKFRTLKKDWFIMINHGAVRAGKTHINNEIFLDEVKRVKRNAAKVGITKPKYILAGVSSKTIYNNVISELEDIYGFNFKYDKHGQFILYGVTIIPAYTGTIAGLGNARGFTAFGAYVNEATLANEQVFSEILKRLSGYGARLICDTNPDHPKHWLMEDYIKKADNDSENIIAFNFQLMDNSFLNKRYIDNVIQSTPKGMMTERQIYGRWVAGEGAIYGSQFKPDVHYVSNSDVPYDHIVDYFCGVDWGFAEGHAGVITLFGETDDSVIYMLKEYSAEKKLIDYWVNIASNIRKKYGDRVPFYCDSARPDNISEFKKSGAKVAKVDKSVLAGIQSVAQKYDDYKLFIVKENVDLFHDEINTYEWDRKSGMPIKKADNVQDSMRYAIHSREVTTPWGF